MKDGTPLVDEEEPSFIAMPSESVDEPEEDDPGEVTIIRKNVPAPPPVPNAIDEISFTPDPRPSSERIVVPTSEEPVSSQARVVRAIPPYQPPPQSNTAKVVVLTIIGTLAVLAIGAIGFRFLQNDNANNSNINTNFNANIANVNTNLNTNIGFDTNFNFNMNANFNTNSLSNINTNANARTPTPTPKPSPSITPSPSGTANDLTPPPTPGPTQTPIIVKPNPSPTVPRMNPLPANRPPANGR